MFFREYLLQPVFAYLYEAQVELFDPKKGRKYRDTVPLIHKYTHCLKSSRFFQVCHMYTFLYTFIHFLQFS